MKVGNGWGLGGLSGVEVRPPSVPHTYLKQGPQEG